MQPIDLTDETFIEPALSTDPDRLLNVQVNGVPTAIRVTGEFVLGVSPETLIRRLNALRGDDHFSL